MIDQTNANIERHIKTHSVRSDDDRAAVSVLETFLAAPYSLYNKPNDVAIALYHFRAPKKGGKLPPFFGYFVEHLQEDKLPLCICRRILFVTGDNFLDTGSQSC